MDNLSNISVIKDVLKTQFTFSKALGQNFLVNPSVCPKDSQKWAMQKRLRHNRIGTGIGVLTKTSLPSVLTRW